MTFDLRHILSYTLSIIFLIIFPAAVASAQSTKVKGRVTDASTGEGIPFAGVYFKNSTIGVSTDIDGYYILETRADQVSVLSASILGYETEEKAVNPKHFNEINFSLQPFSDELSAAVVKPDDSYVRSILKKIDEAKSRNDPERRPFYDCEVYSKDELDLTNPKNQVINKLLPKDFKFVYDYMDTSVVSGQPFLPVMISEASSRYYHSSNPESKKEVIKMSRISGIEEDKTVAQFTGNTYVRSNFYDDFINIFEVEIPSPVSSEGTTYYNYYLIDSLKIDGRKTYKIRYHPSKWVSSPTFDGEMSVDAEDYAIRDLHAKLKNGSNVNWIRALVLDVENQRLPDSTWFYSRDKIYVDFSATLRDSSKVVSMIAQRQTDYSDPEFRYVDLNSVSGSKAAVVAGKDVLDNDEEDWQKIRPFPLSTKEKGIYNMVDSIKNVALYKSAVTVVNTFLTGFYDFKYFGIGPYSSLYSFNNLEGDRAQFGIRTTKNFSRKYRIMGYGAYGFKDRQYKGGGVFEYMFNNQPTSKLAIMLKHDVMQLGRGSDAFGNGNIVQSVLTKANSQKMSMVNDYSISWQREWADGFNTTLALESRRIFSNRFVPMIATDGWVFNSVGYNQAHLQMRFSKDEIVTRGVFEKDYFYTAYPVVTLDLIGSMNGIGKNEYTFFRPELSVRYTWLIPPFGTSKFKFNVGTILGTVPYPMLKIHEGNGTYVLDNNAFSCMNYYEFASDTWTTFFWEHNFKGFFLGKIPLLKKLQLREIVTLKAAYGTISDKNNGIVGDPSYGAVMMFPEGMKKLNKPYIEMGVGVSNIFRMIRIDANWRMTHRYEIKDGVRVPHDNRFVVTVGTEFKF